jgi:nucleoside-diphosphate-sugar epimerase
MNKKETILITGACGQIGTELTAALRQRYGREHVIATDRLGVVAGLTAAGPYHQLDILDKYELEKLVCRYQFTQIYHLAAMLSAAGEQSPQKAWNVNMQGLLNVLEIARLEKVGKVFWPSSIAVFGPDAPKEDCPQHAVAEPATVYGISKAAGEHWCRYYANTYGMDIRSLRYPGLISYSAPPGGGTTDYAVDIFHQALRENSYTSFLSAGTRLPMLYMPDAIRATIELMEAPKQRLRISGAYNLGGLSFTPEQIGAAIRRQLPGFTLSYAPDFRQHIADSWPGSIEDLYARDDWDWSPRFSLEEMTGDMLLHLKQRANV